ncbi:replication initiator protein A [Azospirillum doebereinerae]
MDNAVLPSGRDVALRDVADLMVWPWFSLAKTPRHQPIHFEQGAVRLRVEPAGTLGLATIWDADVLIWAISQLTEALDTGRTPTRQLHVTPYRLLRFLGRSTGRRDYALLRAAFDRLAATRVETTLRAADPQEPVRFHWLERWEPSTVGVSLTLPEWLFTAVLERRVLTLDPGYTALTGGMARWLYRLVRKMGGRQRDGGVIGLRRLHARSGSPARYASFALGIRRIAAFGLPGYQLSIKRGGGEDRLLFSRARTEANLSTEGCGQAVEDVGTSPQDGFGTTAHRFAGQRAPDSESSACPASRIQLYNFYNVHSNKILAADSSTPLPVGKFLRTGRAGS